MPEDKNTPRPSEPFALAAEPARPTLSDLARALDDAKAAHAAANERSNASAKKAADDQAIESLALQDVNAARDAQLAAAQR